jgi:hypothetical protein
MLLSVSSKAIYEMEPEIQNLDDEFVNKIVWMALEEIRGLRLSEGENADRDHWWTQQRADRSGASDHQSIDRRVGR